MPQSKGEQSIVLDFGEQLSCSLGLQHGSHLGLGWWPLGVPVMGEKAMKLIKAKRLWSFINGILQQSYAILSPKAPICLLA